MKSFDRRCRANTISATSSTKSRQSRHPSTLDQLPIPLEPSDARRLRQPRRLPEQPFLLRRSEQLLEVIRLGVRVGCSLILVSNVTP